LDLGKWLKQRGEGIYDSRPWTRALQILDDKTELRFTQKNKTLYVYFMNNPANRTITIPDCRLEKGAKAVLVGEKEEAVRLITKQDAVQIELPKKLAFSHVFLVKISGLKDE
jgi:alpha-L-fucosidase